MVSVLKRVETFPKEEVKDLISENYKMLDEELIIVGKDLGRRGEILWDSVGVDGKKRLVVIAIEQRYTDKMFYQIVNRLDWAWEHMENIKKMYPAHEIDDDQMPRVIIVAPSYDTFFKKSITYLTYRMKINLFTYTCLKNGEEKSIFLEPVETRVTHEQVLKSDSKRMKAIEVPHNTKVTTEEIMEFLH